MKVKNVYMYAACLVCLVVALISLYTVVSGISSLIWFDKSAQPGIYLYQQLFNGAIMLIVSSLLFIFHWRHTDK
jgi:hypothetical protein